MNRPVIRLIVGGLVWLLSLAPPSAFAAETRAELLEFLSGMESLRAEFDQVIINAEGREIQQASGDLLILRPGRFRWSYQEPYEQLIITDGETLWVYEPDLEQVTVSALDTSVGNTPALLLSTDQPLEELFEISGPEADGELTWLLLEPRADETSFTRIFLGFYNGVLMMMEIIDGFEQTVRIRFDDVRRNVRIDPALFHFTPPQGIDVIRER